MSCAHRLLDRQTAPPTIRARQHARSAGPACSASSGRFMIHQTSEFQRRQGPSTCVRAADPTATATRRRCGPRGRARVIHPLARCRPEPVEWRRRTRSSGGEFTERPDHSTISSVPGDQVGSARTSTWHPADADDVTGPGTAHTGRPMPRPTRRCSLLRCAARLHDHRGTAQRRDERLRVRNRCRAGRTARRILGDHQSIFAIRSAARNVLGDKARRFRRRARPR